MSVAAMTWAFHQCLPAKPKLILLALSDQTDEVTGKVCYGRTDLDYLAVKTSIPRRTLTRYIGALVRNSYMRVESNKDRGQANHYWMCLDRSPAEDIKDWKFKTAAEDGDEHDDADESSEMDETQDVEDGGPKWPTLPAPETAESDVQNGLPGRPPDGPGVGHMDGPQESTTYQRTSERACEEKKANGFSKQAQDEDRDSVVAEKVNKTKIARYFVIEGTRAYEAWAAEMRRRTGLRSWNLTIWASFEGKQRCGWYFPSLFPPAKQDSTAPPGTLSDEDARALSGM